LKASIGSMDAFLYAESMLGERQRKMTSCHFLLLEGKYLELQRESRRESDIRGPPQHNSMVLDVGDVGLQEGLSHARHQGVYLCLISRRGTFIPDVGRHVICIIRRCKVITIPGLIGCIQSKDFSWQTSPRDE